MSTVSQTRLILGPEQRDRLTHLGLVDAQIHKLENALPLCRAWLSKPATLLEVREKLADIAKPVRQAKKAMDALTKSTSLASREACNRILLAVDHMQPGEYATSVVVEKLNWVFQAVEDALKSLPTTQRRNNDANPLPIQLIERALLDGFVAHYSPGGQALPEYHLRTSRKKAPFPEIVAICYEAIGRGGDPDRAIRNYLELKKRKKPRPNIKMVMQARHSGVILEMTGPDRWWPVADPIARWENDGGSTALELDTTIAPL